MITISQNNQTPVFALTDKMFGHVGTVLDQDIAKRDEFQHTFSDLADRILALVRNASSDPAI